MVNGAVAFVASTLPFQQIARYYRELGLTEVVCAGPHLADSYRKGFAMLNIGLRVTGLVGSSKSRSFKLLLRLIRAPEIVIFHECCWFQIDVLLLLIRRKVRYFPTVDLSDRKKISHRDVPPQLRLRALLASRWFDVYETPVDGGPGVYIAFAVKPSLRQVDPVRAYSGLVPPQPRAPAGNSSRKLLLLCSTDPIPDEVLRDAYMAIIDKLVAAGIEVHTKDHPRLDARLNLRHPKVIATDASLPLECMDLSGYCAFLSLASTSVAAGRGYGEIISIARMLPAEYRERLDTRLRHLETLGVRPHLPGTIEELVTLVSSGPRS